jgi:hypothetical protein
MADPLEVIAEKAVRDVAIATQTALQRAAPAYVQRSIDVTVKGSGAHAVATVRARGFSSIVIAGQRSHTIEPVQAGALAWRAEIIRSASFITRWSPRTTSSRAASWRRSGPSRPHSTPRLRRWAS